MTGFAAIETATAEHAVAVFANATAVISSVSRSVLFDNGYAELLGVAGTGPSILGVGSDLSAATQGGSLTVNGTSYTVTAIEPDGTGLTRLRLQEA